MNGRRVRRILGSGVLGFAAFGAWAYGANFDYPSHRLASALSQGTFSLFFSLVVMSITEATFAMLAGRRWRVPLSIAVPVLTSVAGGALIHLAAHTPSIVLTLLGPSLIGAVYQTVYVLKLRCEAASTRAPSSEPSRRRRVAATCLDHAQASGGTRQVESRLERARPRWPSAWPGVSRRRT